MIEEIRKQLQVVAEARRKETKLEKRYGDLIAAFDAEHDGLVVETIKSKAARQAAEAELREVAVAHYEATGEKHPTPGVEIKIVKRLEYEEGAALAWAIEHTLALSLNRKQFEKLCKFLAPDFVTIIPTPRAEIATDLKKVAHA